MKSLNEHTPLPWEVTTGSITANDGEIPIANMVRDTPKTSPCERDNNARLIVHAPKPS